MALKVARAALVSLLVLLVAVTPLNALIQPGRFEVVIRGNEYTPALTVVLYDRTGLVKGIAAADPSDVDRDVDRADTVMFLAWGGGLCDASTQFTFERFDDGFRLTERTLGRSGICHLVLVGRSIAVHLWVAIDPATVEFDAIESRVR